jgi:hypothetical protein
MPGDACSLATISSFGWRESALARLIITEGTIIGLTGSLAGAGLGLGAAACFAGHLPARLIAIAAAAAAGGSSSPPRPRRRPAAPPARRPPARRGVRPWTRASHDPQIAARSDRLIRLRDGAGVDDIDLTADRPVQDVIRHVGQLG